MKMIAVAFLAVLAVAATVPVDSEKRQPQIVRSQFDQGPEGGYSYNFETEDGISKQETAVVKTVPDEENKPVDIIEVRGSYAYTGPNGELIQITYIANENGFKAEGDSIPKVPSPTQ